MKALESLLVEKGLVDPAAVDAVIDYYEHRVGPRNGARVIARAWSDPDYKARLLRCRPGGRAMNSIHDMGGMQGFGPLVREAEEPLFHAPWEARIVGVMPALGAWRKWHSDVFRQTIESVPAADYLRTSYYEKRLNALTTLAIEAGLLSREEVATGQVAPGTPKLTPCLAPEAVSEGSAGRIAGPPAAHQRDEVSRCWAQPETQPSTTQKTAEAPRDDAAKAAAISPGTLPCPTACGAPMRCGSTIKTMPTPRQRRAPNASHAMPPAVQQAVTIHQICRSSSAPLSIPGNSGGRPNAGASEKAAYPATPHAIPCRGAKVRPLRSVASLASAFRMSAKPKPASMLKRTVSNSRRCPSGPCPDSADAWP